MASFPLFWSVSPKMARSTDLGRSPSAGHTEESSQAIVESLSTAPARSISALVAFLPDSFVLLRDSSPSPATSVASKEAGSAL